MRCCTMMAILALMGTLYAFESKSEAVKLSEEEKALLTLTNAERKKEGLEPLKPSARLLAAARGHCANMAKQDKLDHTLDDKTLVDRVKAEGYKYARVGENIAWNHRKAEEAVEGWMQSPGHKANILGATYTEIGVAVAKNARGERYWIQVFGQPPE
ncbi:MAG: CAP domain-containing protein [Gemmataceae bacterium]